MLVSDIMTKNPQYIHPEMSVPDALSFLREAKIGRVPVLNEDNELVGIVTKNDLANSCPSSATTLDMYEINYLLSKLKVHRIMTKKVLTVQEDTAVEEAARIMSDNDLSALPVMRGDALVGIVSDGDLFRLFIDLFGARQEGLRITLMIKDRVGILKDLTATIADNGGNIITMVTCDGHEEQCKYCLIKLTGLSKERVIEIVSPLATEIVTVKD